MRKLLVVVAYFVVFFTAVFLYVHYPASRESVRFWLPQGLLALTLVMTSLYVLFTAELVAETRRLQQRPLVEVAFREVETANCAAPKFSKLYDHGLEIYQGLARKMIEGEKLAAPTKSLVLELKNIGQVVARAITVAIKIADPTGSYTDELVVNQALAKDGGAVQLQIAPMPIAFGIIEIASLTYGDGLRTYTECVGPRTYKSGLE